MCLSLSTVAYGVTTAANDSILGCRGSYSPIRIFPNVFHGTESRIRVVNKERVVRVKLVASHIGAAIYCWVDTTFVFFFRVVIVEEKDGAITVRRKE